MKESKIEKRIKNILGAALVTLGWIYVLVLITRWVIQEDDSLMVGLILILLAIPCFGLIVFIASVSYYPFMGEGYTPKCPKCGNKSFSHFEEWACDYGRNGYSYLKESYSCCTVCGYSTRRDC